MKRKQREINKAGKSPDQYFQSCDSHIAMFRVVRTVRFQIGPPVALSNRVNDQFRFDYSILSPD
jgi:hypothetical protein